MQWVFNGYMLTLASLLLLGGSAGDRFDRRTMFLVGLVGFAAASVACGLAPSAGWLIGARMAQGAAAALLMPISLAIVGAAYGGKERGRAIGIWLAAGTLAIAISRPLGGWLIDSFGWRAIFFVNVPLAAAAFMCGLGLARDRVRERREPLDTRGALLAILALGLLSYGLIALGRGERVAGLAAAAASAPLFWLFISAEGRARGAMMPLSLFRNVSFAGANALTFFFYAALSAVFFMLPYVMIDVHGYSAVAAGAAFLPLSAIMAAGSPFSGALVERAGPRATLVAGSALTAAGYLLLAASGTIADYATGFLPGLVVVGIGVTLSVAPLTTAVFDSAPDDQTGAASGINSAVDVTGGLVAVAALGLAFGGAEIGGMEGPALVNAYQVVAVAGAVLAGMSAVVAGVTIRRAKRPVP
jgi:EmrB/QacA subfamily drug resistance transporter